MKKLAGLLAACTVVTAINSLRPNAQWSLRGDTYAGLEWADSTQTKPTLSEIVNQIQACRSAETQRAIDKAAARQTVKDQTKTTAERIQALAVILDLDQ